MKKFEKNKFFKIFVLFFLTFFFEIQIFRKKFLYNPSFLWLPLVFYMKKRIYMKVRHSQLHHMQNGEPLKVLQVDSTPRSD